MLYGGINLYSTVRLYFYYSEKYTCYAVVSTTLTLFCTPVHLNKHNVTFIKFPLKRKGCQVVSVLIVL